MYVVYPRCCGLDVHKASVTACVLVAGKDGKQKHLRRFGTMTDDLLELADWLDTHRVTQLAMESTGVYWKPIWNLLEDRVPMLLVNAQHLKTVPGRKTDMKDCEWIADLLQHGLLRGSFVPPETIRELRDLSRNRAILVQQRATVSNRIEKVLEDANIKLASVASHVLGQSGRAMLHAMVNGTTDPGKLADMARAKLRNKIPQLRRALEGKLAERHRFQLKQLLEQLEFLDGRIADFAQQIKVRSQPFQEEVALLMTIPGVDWITATSLLAEVGADMGQFPTAGHLASWAGICPGNYESAGKNYTGPTRKGNAWLRRALCQAAWAASHTKGTYLAALYHRIAARRGKNRAILAVAHSTLIAAYHILQRRQPYQELGGAYFDQLNSTALRRYLVRRLERLGNRVTLEPVQIA